MQQVSVQLQQVALPALREELQILPGAALHGGASSWLIYDPVQTRYFQIGVEVFELLSLWSSGTVAALAESVRSRFGRHVDAADVTETIEFLHRNSLTESSASGSHRDYLEQLLHSKKSWFKKVLHGYLFIRIPLVKPQRFLQRTYPQIRPLFNRKTGMLIAVLTLLALYLVSRQWESFLHQVPNLFSLSGVAVYLVALLLVKLLHELGHAYTAVHLGSRVTTMGVAFMVMMPVLYTDTTDAWRLASARKRAWIDAAGIIVELSIAGLATLLWIFLSDGAIRSAVFALAATSWTLSLLVNLNPLMRFDGYYLLADSLGIQNLQPRSFELAKWQLREWLFGLNERPPEPAHLHRRFMTGYGYAVWIYRFFLFLAIALLVYTFFFKVLGIFLFAVEIIWFIGLPIWREVRFWWSERERIAYSRRSHFTLGFITLLALMLFVPWSGAVHVPAILTSQNVYTIYSLHDARVARISFYPGMEVNAGDVLVEFESPEFEHDLRVIDQEIELLRARQARRVADPHDRDASIVLAQQLNAALARRDGIQQEVEELWITADFAGVVTDTDSSLQVGQWVNKQLPLGMLADISTQSVKGYLDESMLKRVKPAQEGVFVADGGNLPAVDVGLRKVARADKDQLDIPYLASVYGGNVLVRSDQDGLVPVEAAFLAEFGLTHAPLEIMQVVRGTVRLEATRESFAASAWRAIARITVREFGI